MSQVIVGKIKAMYEDIETLPPQYHRWLRDLERRGYSFDDQLDPLDIEKVINLWTEYY